MSDMTIDAPPVETKRSARGTLWIILLVAWLGWMFDGMEMGLYSVLARPALMDLLKTDDPKHVGSYVGLTLALFLLGCSVGGFLFGRLGDKIGRVKTMIITVLMYSVFTGLSAFSQNAWQFGACRFLGATGLGGEWGLGVALVMETWPNAKRPVLAGLLGSSANVGFLVSSLVNMQFGHLGWRFIFCIGVVPALLSFAIRLLVKEPERWVRAKVGGQKSNLGQLFEPKLRKRTMLACLISAVPIIGTWGVFQWNPTWVGEMVHGDTHKVAIVAMWMAFGQIVGSFLGGPAADWFGRRMSYAIFCIGSLASCLMLYSVVDSYGVGMFALLVLAGVCTTTFFGWLPLYLPELFPTRIRATGEGISFNFGRIIAALGIFLGTGQLVAVFGGSYAKATAVMSLIYIIGLALIRLAPETRGTELPD